MTKEMRSSSGPWGVKVGEGGKGDRSLTGSPMGAPLDDVGKKGDGRGKNKVFRGTDSFEGCRLTVKVRQKRTGQAVVDVELEGAVEGEEDGGRREKKGKKSDRRNGDGRKSFGQVMTEQPYRLLVQVSKASKPMKGSSCRLQWRLFASQILS
ncbi:hypothetical protein BO79DRAFT_238208 [Aspergillus costaricaensis CBS 115574]|uniref:Uncharacterized protein n=1 Tax=Aspergillus costaricaensis CBS 115574 TaxID=1448317 RepID=A0ACD1ID11_9EURO|nr:hypothetical protein BO79DRAFT_238208 [Aspergillus costaricaensis CBS 115574]RAK88181.1 hypothetical protein BO79DRAFT_238208 [Aspergillus costaricaensis CBS 115574]